MTETLVERVVAALMAAIQEQTGDDARYAGQNNRAEIDGVISLEPLARAAIAAMREPDEAMQYAGDDFMDTYEPCGVDEVALYRAMIDAALTSPA
jgi:hypothetical protein